MNDSRFNNWIRDWKNHLLEVFVIAAIVASGLTTLNGAFHIFNRSMLVAALLTLFFQGGMYVIGHQAAEKSQDRRHRRTLALCLSWALLASFSVYSSALGMFEIQQESLKNDNARAALVNQWNEAEKEISRFRTEALTGINQARQAAELELKAERNRAYQARRQRQSFSPVNLQRLTSELDALKEAESKVRRIELLSIVPPEETGDARRALDQAFNSVKEAYSALPTGVRSRTVEPQPVAATQVSDHVQKAFWAELLSGSVPARIIVFFAFMLDLLPPLVRFATAEKRTLPERIIGFRGGLSDLRRAFRVPLSADTESVKVTVEGFPELGIQFAIPAARGGPLLKIDRDFAQVTEEVSRERGLDARLQSAETRSGRLLTDGLPLLMQLGDDREVILKYAPADYGSLTRVN